MNISNNDESSKFKTYLTDQEIFEFLKRTIYRIDDEFLEGVDREELLKSLVPKFCPKKD